MKIPRKGSLRRVMFDMLRESEEGYSFTELLEAYCDHAKQRIWCGVGPNTCRSMFYVSAKMTLGRILSMYGKKLGPSGSHAKWVIKPGLVQHMYQTSKRNSRAEFKVCDYDRDYDQLEKEVMADSIARDTALNNQREREAHSSALRASKKLPHSQAWAEMLSFKPLWMTLGESQIVCLEKGILDDAIWY